jgi:hypothetical protein
MSLWKKYLMGTLLVLGAAFTQPAQATPVSVGSLQAAKSDVLPVSQARWVWVGHHHRHYYRHYHRHRFYHHRRYWGHRHWHHHYRHHWRPYYHHRYYYRRW